MFRAWYTIKRNQYYRTLTILGLTLLHVALIALKLDTVTKRKGMEHSLYTLEKKPTLRLVQITDTHLYGHADGELLGLNTRESFECVLDLVKKNHPNPDAIIVSGDISQDLSFEAYEYLHQNLLHFSCPKFLFEGNHDHPDFIKEIAQGNEYTEQLVRSDHWQLILLNSQVPTKVHGVLATDQLQLLEQSLQERPDLHSLISFHHHPIPMGSQWLDKIGLHNNQELLDIIAKYPNVRCILWGHVHQETDQVINDVRYISSPSTCIQFKPNSTQFAIDDLAPGYRWLNLLADGSIETGVERVNEVAFSIDINGTGY